MISDNEKLNKFINAVNDEIDRKIQAIINEAEKEKQAILDKAENEATEAAENYYNINYKRNDKQFVRDISYAELNAKKEIIQHREEVVNKIFKEVKQKLMEFRNSPKYVDMLIKNLLVMHISEDTEIYLCADDMKYAELLKKAIPSQNIKISVSERIMLGGILVYNASRGVIIDKTFDLALEENKRIFVNSNAFSK